MILFWILLVLIVLISLSLAYLSMKDYRELPVDSCKDYGLFLIRNPQALASKTLDSLHEQIADRRQKTGITCILSLERLFRGGESALVIYGPKDTLKSQSTGLDLLELEDYSKREVQVSGWEARIKSGQIKLTSIFSNIPKLENQEQVWYQLLLQLRKTKQNISSVKQFDSQIRVIVQTHDIKRRRLLVQKLQEVNGLIKIPQTFSSRQILEFYRKRSMVNRAYLQLTSDEIVKIWSLPQSVS